MRYALACWLCFLLPFSGSAQRDSLWALYTAEGPGLQRAKLAYELLVVVPESEDRLRHQIAVEGYAALKGVPPARVRSKLANYLGGDCLQAGAYDSALYWYRIARETAHEVGETELEYAVLGNIGKTYSVKGDYPAALQAQLAALAYWERKGDGARILRLQEGIGNTYNYMGKYDRALQYYNKVYNATRGGGTTREASILQAMGQTHREAGDLDGAERLLRRSLKLQRATKDSTNLDETLSELGIVLGARKDYPGQLALFREALGVAVTLNRLAIADIIRHNIAEVEMEQGHFANARQQFQATLALARKNGDVRVAQYALGNLVRLADSMHDYAAALGYSQQLQEAVDTVASVTYQSGIADAETRYQTQLALRTRDSLAYQSRLQAAERRRAVQQRNAAIAIGGITVVLLALIAGFVLRIRSIRARRGEERRATAALFEGEQAERIRIARDLHDSIGQMLSVARIQVSGLGAAAQPSVALLDKTIGEVRAISHNLIPEELNFGLLTALDSLCDRINGSGTVRAVFEPDDSVRDRAFTKQFETAVYRIVQEVVNNMLKHAAATQIRIGLEPADAGLVLAITDNGKGFDASRLDASTGLGWKNIRARVGLLNGVLAVRSERITGTRIEIALPSP